MAKPQHAFNGVVQGRLSRDVALDALLVLWSNENECAGRGRGAIIEPTEYTNRVRAKARVQGVADGYTQLRRSNQES